MRTTRSGTTSRCSPRRRENSGRILTRYHSAERVESRLDETEVRNLARYGYSIKAFALSMVETAIELTEGRISGAEIQQVMGLAWEMLQSPLSLLGGVRETVEELAAAHKLMVITKGGIFEQEAKLARSGLGDLFSHVEIVSEKNQRTYETIATRHRVSPHKGSAALLVNHSRSPCNGSQCSLLTACESLAVSINQNSHGHTYNV